MKKQYLLELDIEEGITKFYIPSLKGVCDDSIKKFSNFIDNSKKEFVIVNKLSIDQMKLIWVLCSELGDILGYSREEMREELQEYFCAARDYEYFSISPSKKDACTMEVATEFTQYIIEFAIEEGYNLILHEGKGDNKTKKHMREVVPDIRRYILACLMNKKCAICQRKADLHHQPSIGSLGYENDTGLVTGFIPLCRNHHTEAHNTTYEEFTERYHIKEIWLTENIVKHLKDNKVYPGHFKAFKED